MGEENFQIIGADGTRLRPLRGLPPDDGRKRGQPPTVSCLPAKWSRAGKRPPSLASRQGAQSGQAPTTPCLPCVRGGAERMRSGGVVGTVQEKAAWYCQPVPARYPQPLSQGLSALPAPLTQGSQALRGILLRRSQALRGILLHRGAKPCGGRSRPRHA